jgi:hypothetical protein
MEARDAASAPPGPAPARVARTLWDTGREGGQGGRRGAPRAQEGAAAGGGGGRRTGAGGPIRGGPIRGGPGRAGVERCPPPLPCHPSPGRDASSRPAAAAAYRLGLGEDSRAGAFRVMRPGPARGFAVCAAPRRRWLDSDQTARRVCSG